MTRDYVCYYLLDGIFFNHLGVPNSANFPSALNQISSPTLSAQWKHRQNAQTHLNLNFLLLYSIYLYTCIHFSYLIKQGVLPSLKGMGGGGIPPLM